MFKVSWLLGDFCAFNHWFFISKSRSYPVYYLSYLALWQLLCNQASAATETKPQTLRQRCGNVLLVRGYDGYQWTVMGPEDHRVILPWRMPPSVMWRRVYLVWTDVSEESIASIFTLNMEALRSTLYGATAQKTAFFIVKLLCGLLGPSPSTHIRHSPEQAAHYRISLLKFGGFVSGAALPWLQSNCHKARQWR
jgi:hypothetical protein